MLATWETLSFFALLLLSLVLVVKSADFAMHYSTRVAQGFLLPKYIIGFLVVAVIGMLPEGMVAISSALKGVPSFGLGTIFGSNVADLTLIFALVVLASGRSLKVESRIIKNSSLYVGVMAIPLILGANGYYSRWEGIVLIASGILFYVFVIKSSGPEKEKNKEKFSLKDIVFLTVSMAALLVGAHLTVKYGVDVASRLQINPLLIGMFVVALGTTLPELFFSLRAAKHNHDSLAIGDILGTVIADATIIVGLIAVISPFAFNPRMIYVTGAFMFFAVALLFYFMKSGRTLNRKEAIFLIIFYLIFALTEFSLGE